jgi:peroxiredoxin
MALTHTPKAALGARAPDFALPGVDGKTHTLASTRGPFGLLVMFICNHCPYVKAIRERLILDVAEIRRAGIGVVAISANDANDYPEDSFERMAQVAHQFGYNFPYVYDAAQAVARAYDAVCTPDFFGYNANLELQYRGRLDGAHLGARTADTKRELVEAMLHIAKTGRGPTEQVPSMGCNIKFSRSNANV